MQRRNNNGVDKVWRPKEKDTTLSKPQDPPPTTSRSKPRQSSNATKFTKRSQSRGNDEGNHSRREKRQHRAGDSYGYDEDYEKPSRGRGGPSSTRKTKHKDTTPEHTASGKRHAEPTRSQKKPRRERERRSDGRSRRVSTDHDTQRSRHIDHDNQGDDREHLANRHQSDDRPYENEEPNRNLAQSQSRSDRNNTRRRNDSGRDRDRTKNVTSPQQRKRRDRLRDGSRRSYEYVAYGESGFSNEQRYRNRTRDSKYDEYSYENESRNPRPARRSNRRQRRYNFQYDEQPVELDHLPQDKEDAPSRESQRPLEPSKTPSQRVESVEMKDSAPPSRPSPQQSQETPAQDPTSPTRPKQEQRSGVFVSPPRATGNTPNGFDRENGGAVNGNVENHVNQSASSLQNVEDAETKEEATAIFSLDDLGRLLNAFDIVFDGLQKMHQNDLAAQMKNYRDELANSLDHKAVPQSLDAFQEVSSMARSNDGGDFSQDTRERPTKPPLRKLRRTLPQVNAPRGLSGAGPRRKPPKVSTAANTFRGFELFGPAAWGYESYHLTSQETSDVSISPDVGYYQKNDTKPETKPNQHATPSSTSTAMNTEISRLNPTAKAEAPARLASPGNGFAQQQPVFQPNYGRAPNGMFPSRGSYGDLQMAPMHTPYMPTNPFSASGTLSGTQTGVTTAQPTPPSSVPTFSTPNVFTDGRVPTVPMMFPAAPHYMSASGPMRIPVMNVAQETYNSQPNAMLRTPSASSVPNQPRASLMRTGDGSYDPSRQFLVKLAISLPSGEKNELYFYDGDNSREVARMFCARHNMLNHSGLVESEINKVLARDGRFQ